MKAIVVEIKNVYGRTTIYPADETAALFSRLTGKKTFDKNDLSTIQSLGYEINVMTPRLESAA